MFCVKYFCMLIHRISKSLAYNTMQINSEIVTTTKPGRGGRISSPKLRASLQQSEDFTGLEENVKHYDLLNLVKRLGKHAGFTPKMEKLLDYYFSFTRDIDWEEGAKPIVYQSLSKTAFDLDVSERQIQRLEKALFEAGAITWNDSGNHRRQGQRCPNTGRILFAYGVDLSPLASLKPKLEEKLQEMELYKKAWFETKRQISWYRNQIKSCLVEASEGQGDQTELNSITSQYEKIAIQIRVHMDLSKLRSLLKDHKELHNRLLSFLEANTPQNNDTAAEENTRRTQKESPGSDQNVVHNKNTNQPQSDKSDSCSSSINCLQESSKEKTEPKPDRAWQTEPSDNSKPIDEVNPVLQAGLQHITLKQAHNAASERFKAHIPMEPRPMNFDDMVVAAYKLKSDLRISQQSWAEACVTLGKAGAAVCLLITDRGTLRENNPVTNPAAYFASMIARGKRGELKLQNTIFGLLKA